MKFPFNRGHTQPKVEDAAVSNATVFYYGKSSADVTVTPRSALNVSTVYACVRVIAETIASLPLNVYEVNPDGGCVKARNHPLQRILHDEPNHEMTSFVVREAMMTNLLLTGNAYLQIIRDGRGKIMELYPLLSDCMTVTRDDTTHDLVYTYTTNQGEQVRLDPKEILHVPGLGFDGIMGYSPIAVERNAIGLSLATEEYGSKFFANGATPSGVLMHPGTVKDPARLRENWSKIYGGSKNANKTAILEEGMTYHQISVPNNDAQFLETRKFQVTEICRIYRVPPHLVGDLEHATFSNIEHQSISFAQHTIRPWITRLEQSMNRALLSDKEKGRYFIQFNLDGLLRGDYQSRMAGYSTGIQNGIYSVNDVRALENMPPVEDADGGNAHMMNGNMRPIRELMALSADNNINTNGGDNGG